MKICFILLLFRYMKALLSNKHLTTMTEIDREHQKIEACISNLGRLVNQDKPDFGKVKRAIVVLGSYIRAHISYEEDWLARNVGQFSEQIKDVNNKFPVIYQGLKNRVEKEGNYVELLAVMYEYAKSWFAEHIDATQNIVCRPLRDGTPNLGYLSSGSQMSMQSQFA